MVLWTVLPHRVELINLIQQMTDLFLLVFAWFGSIVIVAVVAIVGVRQSGTQRCHCKYSSDILFTYPLLKSNSDLVCVCVRVRTVGGWDGENHDFLLMDMLLSCYFAKHRHHK